MGNISIKSFTFVYIAVCLVGCSNSSNRQAASSPTPLSNTANIAKENEDAFAAQKSRFTTLPEKVQLTNKPYIRGKAAFYQQTGSTASQSLWSLKNDLGNGYGSSSPLIKKDEDVNGILALTPSEVQTVILKSLKCEKIRKGTYTVKDANIKIPGFVERCELIIVDLTIPAVIFRKQLEAEVSEFDIEFLSSNQAEVFRRLLNHHIYNYLKSLPRK